ncbi:MAG TPA: glycosyltransferase family 2 protein, partial [Terriglobales bacterium]|nr:glycosyltransferase family 2 protein [Terriglobales bacterium]
MPKPLVSVVMPVLNEAHSIADSVRSILAQNLNDDYDLEICVVDGRSTDGSVTIIEKIASQDSRVRLIENVARKTPTAFNLGIRAARGEYVCILGAHASYAADYIAVCLREMHAHGASGCSGRIITVPANNSVQAQLAAWTMASRFASSPFSVRTKCEGFVDTIPYPVFRRETLLQVGGYDERLDRNQDNDLSHRLRAAGHRLLLTSKTQSLYRARPTINALLKFAYWSGWWNGVSLRTRPKSMSLRHITPAAFVSGMLILTCLATGLRLTRSPQWIVPAALLVAVLVAYAALALVTAAWTAIREQKARALLLPLVFFGFHAAYGSGTLCAL